MSLIQILIVSGLVFFGVFIGLALSYYKDDQERLIELFQLHDKQDFNESWRTEEQPQKEDET